MTENLTADTIFHEPSMTADEAEMLIFAIERSRAQFAWKCGGLDAAGLSAQHPPTSMTLGGLLKHLAFVEDDVASRRIAGQPRGEPWASADFRADPDWEWHSAADDSPDELYGLWRAAVGRSRAAITAVLAEGGPGQLVKMTTSSGSPNLRRILTDLHDEYARHVGHADLLREVVDGLTGEDPPQP